MCKLKSGLLFKDRVFLPDYDSHGDMLDELGITDDYISASNTFVRFEVCPAENCLAFTDPKDWIYKVDQDILPDWYDAIDGENRAREAVKKWFNDHVHIGQKIRTISRGIHYVKDCDVRCICGNANVVTVCGNSTVDSVRGNAFIKRVAGNATVNYVCENANVETVCGNATIKSVYENAVIKYLYGNATVCSVSFYATIKLVYDNAVIKCVYDNATVNSVSGNAKVNRVCDNAIVKSACGNSNVDDISGNAIVVIGEKIIVATNSYYELRKGTK